MSQCQCKYAQSRGAGLRRVLTWARCLMPGFLLVLVPKCPLCIMAYAAMLTGLGMSFATASYVRMAMIVVCVAAVVYLVGRQGMKLRRQRQHNQ